MTAESTEFESPSPERLSELLSGYHVETLVSSGIGGAIYEARQVSLDRKVTIKVLPPSIGMDATLRAAFEAEAKTMARLNDPNLVDVFDFGDIEGMLFIIMEHVPGRSLHETTHGSHVDQKESARLVADVCHGLHHAHQEGIVHRALKPGNILINNEAQPKIVDFGLASLFAQQTAGTPDLYAAPETRLPNAEVDHRADIYSAGMILYDLVVGRLPEEPYVSPSSARQCRPEIDEVVYKAIQPDPKKRYSSAEDMALDLEKMLEKMGAPPTQEAIKTLVTTSPSASAKPLPRPVAIPSSSSSSNSALIVTLLVVAVLGGMILLAVKSASSPTESKKEIAKEKPAAKPKKKPTPKPRAPRPKPPRKKPSKPTIPPDLDIADNPPTDPTPAPDPPRDNDDKDTKIAGDSDPIPGPPAKPDTTEPPEFDREAWLEKARAFMRKKARNKLIDYDTELLKNIDSFERDVKRIIRRMDRDKRKPVEIESDATFVKLRELGRFPEKPPEGTPGQTIKIYPVALSDQKEVDLEFIEDFTRLKIIYTQGIDKQISNLRNEGNDEHADALEEEIKVTQEGMERFMRILRGQEPDPEPEEDEKKGKKKGKKDK